MTFISSGLLTVIQKCPYAVKRLLIRGKSVKIYQWILCKWNRSGLSLMKQTSQQTSSVILVKRYSKFHAWFLKYPNVFETFWLFFFLLWLDWHQPLMIRYDWLLLPFPQAGDIYLSASSPSPPQLLIIFFHTYWENSWK